MDLANTKHDSIWASPWAAPFVVYGLFAFACIVLLQSTVIDMVKLWAGSSSWHHSFLVGPLALMMIYDNRSKSPAPRESLAALGFVALAALCWLAGRAAGFALIEHLAFVGLLVAGVSVAFGPAMVRVHAFPLAFLFFMAPFGESLMPILQTVTTSNVTALLSLVGAEISRDGYLISTAWGDFMVAKSCAGLNFLLAAILGSAFFAYTWFANWRKRIGFMAMAAAIAIVANTLRVFLVIMLAKMTPEAWDIASDHVAFGLVLYTIMLALLLTLGWRMADRKTGERG